MDFNVPGTNEQSAGGSNSGYVVDLGPTEPTEASSFSAAQMNALAAAFPGWTFNPVVGQTLADNSILISDYNALEGRRFDQDTGNLIPAPVWGADVGVQYDAYEDSGDPYNNVHWIQIATTDSPVGNAQANVPFVDNGGAATPYYDDTGAADDSSFIDNPRRTLGDDPVDWSATTLIVEQTAANTVELWQGFNWGWSGTLPAVQSPPPREHDDYYDVQLTADGGQSNFAGDSVTLDISAYDESGYPPTFSATSLPSGLAINSTTGAITGTVIGTEYTNALDIYWVVVTATDDSTDDSASFSCVWTVAPAGSSPGSGSDTDGTFGSIDRGAQSDYAGDVMELRLPVPNQTALPSTDLAAAMPPGYNVDSFIGVFPPASSNANFTSNFFSIIAPAADAESAPTGTSSFNPAAYDPLASPLSGTPSAAGETYGGSADLFIGADQDNYAAARSMEVDTPATGWADDPLINSADGLSWESRHGVSPGGAIIDSNNAGDQVISGSENLPADPLADGSDGQPLTYIVRVRPSRFGDKPRANAPVSDVAANDEIGNA
jgi:hypothetical protein